MSLIALLDKRYSTRAYLDKPIPQPLLGSIFLHAQQAP
jgi:nitroreductase